MAQRTSRIWLLVSLAIVATVAAGVAPALAGRNETSGAGTEAARFGLLDAGEYYTCAVNNGDILCWGRPSFDWMYAVPTVVTVGGSPFRPGTIRDLSVGGYMYQGTACAIVDGVSVGEVWCWGSNLYGQFANGTNDASTNEYNTPVRAFGNLTGATRVTVGGNHVCVLTSSNGVKCAGDDSSGELGDSTNIAYNAAVDVTDGMAPLTNVISISAGGSTTCAVLNDGSTWCWGDSGMYQSGRITTSNSNVAQQVYDNGGSTSVVVSGPSVCTLGSYGANCWGENTRPAFASSDTPRLGVGETGSTVVVSSPVTAINFIPTALITTVTHSCALHSNGEVWCWGDNAQGYLGNATTTDSVNAVKVNLPGPVDVITGGIAYTCAVDRVGQMWCWGTGDLGALGNDSFAFRSTPALVSTRSLGWTYMSTAPTTTTSTSSTTTTTTTSTTTTTTLAPTTTSTSTTTSTTSTTTTSTTTTSTTTTSTTTTTLAPTTTSSTTTLAPTTTTTTTMPAPATTLPGPSTSAAPTSSIAPSNPPTSQQIASLPTSSITQSLVASGTRLIMSHQGFTPGETVDAGTVDDSRVLASSVADGSGRAVAEIVLNAPRGSTVDMFMIGRSSGHGARQRVSVVDTLVDTGSNSSPAVNVALALLVLGTVLVARGRRPLC